ncbi:MAG TPA: FHA domain-containing protein, partial [Myxococcota bacterium]|nr:FHA domain-containing protein [Myxococcota bacterium]
MHRVTWSMGPQSLALLYPNGAHVLPEPIAAATHAHAIVLVEGFAYLAFDDGLREVPSDLPFAGDGWSLTWMREPLLRPSAMMGERTRSDEGLPCGAVVTVFDPEGREHPVDGRPILVGRHPSCDIPTVDRRVSLFHCALLRSGEAIRVVDLGSRNGTYVDGTRVGEATLARHAALRVGRKRLEVRATLPDGGPTPARSPAMRLVESQVARIAPSSATVTIEGESGAGKEIVARQLHQLSGRGGA